MARHEHLGIHRGRSTRLGGRAVLGACGVAVIAGARSCAGWHGSRSARAALAVPRPHVQRSGPGDAVALRHHRRVVLLGRLPAGGRERVVGAAAGVSLLPATVLMLLLSAPSGALTQRIGPRLQLTIGPLVAAAGLLLLARIGPARVVDRRRTSRLRRLRARPRHLRRPAHRDRWPRQRGSCERRIRRKQCRCARRGFAALAFIPVVSGLSIAVGPRAVTHSFRVALMISAAVAVVASPFALFGLRPHVRRRRTARRVHCAVDGAPLQPDPARCPELAA